MPSGRQPDSTEFRVYCQKTGQGARRENWAGRYWGWARGLSPLSSEACKGSPHWTQQVAPYPTMGQFHVSASRGPPSIFLPQDLGRGRSGLEPRNFWAAKSLSL